MSQVNKKRKPSRDIDEEKIFSAFCLSDWLWYLNVNFFKKPEPFDILGMGECLRITFGFFPVDILGDFSLVSKKFRDECRAAMYIMKSAEIEKPIPDGKFADFSNFLSLRCKRVRLVPRLQNADVQDILLFAQRMTCLRALFIDLVSPYISNPAELEPLFVTIIPTIGSHLTQLETLLLNSNELDTLPLNGLQTLKKLRCLSVEGLSIRGMDDVVNGCSLEELHFACDWPYSSNEWTNCKLEKTSKLRVINLRLVGLDMELFVSKLRNIEIFITDAFIPTGGLDMLRSYEHLRILEFVQVEMRHLPHLFDEDPHAAAFPSLRYLSFHLYTHDGMVLDVVKKRVNDRYPNVELLFTN